MRQAEGEGWDMDRPGSAAAGLALFASLAACGARADAIDGHWCSARGLMLSIDGPRMVTPGGARIEGDYSRHGFVHVVPAAEPGGGQKAVLTLAGDRLLQRRVGEGEPEPWRRCAPATS